jgi:hypothetical protein
MSETLDVFPDFTFKKGELLKTKIFLTKKERDFLKLSDPQFADFEKFEKMVWTRNVYTPEKGKIYKELDNQPNYCELFKILNECLFIYKKQAQAELTGTGDMLGFD